MNTNGIQEFVIKNMVCSRCIKVVRENLESIGLEVIDVRLGKVKVRIPKGRDVIDEMEKVLQKDDFSIARNKDEALCEKIKLALINLLSDLPVNINLKLSDYLVKELHKDYGSLSKTFSRIHNITLERYYIQLRIEKAKELIEYGEMNFSEIAFTLGYHHLNHLSSQFKQVTGMSMTEYKTAAIKYRDPLNRIM